MDTHRGRRRLLTLAIGALLVSPFASVRAADQTVYERGVQFDKPQVEVFVGETVTWVYVSSPSNSGHTVTFEDDTLNNERFENCPDLLFDDCQRSPSDRFVRTFPKQGTFPYYCKLHRTEGMRGVVVVAPAPTTTISASTSSTTAPKPSTTTTRKATSSTTSTTRPLATSSTLASSSTTSTTPDTSSVLLPGDPPPFSADDINSSAAGRSGGSDNGSDTTTVALIVALLLAVSAGGGYLLWRLRPGRA